MACIKPKSDSLTGLRQVVRRPSADLEKLGLATNAQFVATVNHLPALINPALVSALSKKSISSACCSILIYRGHKSTGLEDLPPRVKHIEGALEQLFLPFRDPRWVQLLLLTKLGQGFILLQSAAKATLALNSSLNTRRARRPDDSLFMMVSC